MRRNRRDQVLCTMVFLIFLGGLMMSAPGRDHYLGDDDHGFQLALGSQVLFGKTPGVDTFNAYGPLVIYVSALGRALSGSLVGETVLCCTFWALALTLVYSLVARRASIPAGVLAAAGAFCLMARFYKWYLWLWPLAVLAALARALESEEGEQARRNFVLGLVVSLAWLHRPDVGSLAAVGALLTLAVHGKSALGRLVLGGVLPVLAWFGCLFVVEGPGAPLYFLRSTFMGGWMAKSGMGTAFPELDFSAPLGASSARVWTYGLLLLAYLGWLATGFLKARRKADDARSRFLFACACMGVAVLHQALHRKDGQHLLQVLAPAIVGLFVWSDGALRAFKADRLGRSGFFARAVLAICAVLVGSSLVRWGRVDLATPEVWPASRYRRLADPLRGARKNALLQPILRLRELTTEDQSILVFPLWPQAYVFAERRMSGMLHGYYEGVYNAEPWSADNLAAIISDPPEVVLVTPDFLGRTSPRNERYARYRASHAAVDEYVRENYPKLMYDDGRVLLLGRGAPPASGGANR